MCGKGCAEVASVTVTVTSIPSAAVRMPMKQNRHLCRGRHRTEPLMSIPVAIPSPLTVAAVVVPLAVAVLTTFLMRRS